MKNFDFKKFAVAHGEKVGFGVLCLLAFYAIFSSSWKGYAETTPDAIKSKVENARTQIESADWPEEEQNAFAPDRDIVKEAENLFRNVPLARYRYSTQMSTPLHRVTEKAREPLWKPIRNLIASSGNTVLAMQLSLEPDPAFGDETLGADGKPVEEAAAPDQDNEFARRSAAAGANNLGGNEPAGGYGADYGDAPESEYGSEMEVDESEMAGYGDGFGDAFLMSGDDMGEGIGGSGGMNANEEGRGFRYVALRGVFPMREQAGEVRNALSLPNTIPDSELVDFIGFEVERKKAIAGQNVWGGEWVPIDLADVGEVLQQAARWENEVVELGVTDPVITMPLPGRVVGFWGRHASHPDLDSFQLSPEEQEREAKRMALYMQKYAELQKNRPPAPVAKGGFYQMSVDFKTIGSAVAGADDYQSFQRDMNQQLFSPEEITKGAAKTEAADVTAAGHLLLFRFFDFAVEPGAAYIYRVRMNIRNPNYNAPLEELVNAESAQGQIRNTEWSVLGKPVIVKHDSQYFLANIDSRRTAASMNIYEWYPETGTLINSFLQTNLGQFVGGKSRAEVLRPAAGTFEEEDVEFTTDDVLVDVVARPKLVSSFHPDLKLRGRPGPMQGIIDQAVVANSSGQLLAMDPVSAKGKKQTAMARLENMNEAFKDLKEVAAAGADDGGLSELLGLGAGDEDEESGMGSSKRRSNPLRRRRGSARSTSALMQSSMGMGMEMGIEGSPSSGGRPKRRR